jgi:hypothetical protein
MLKKVLQEVSKELSSCADIVTSIASTIEDISEETACEHCGISEIKPVAEPEDKLYSVAPHSTVSMLHNGNVEMTLNSVYNEYKIVEISRKDAKMLAKMLLIASAELK